MKANRAENGLTILSAPCYLGRMRRKMKKAEGKHKGGVICMEEVYLRPEVEKEIHDRLRRVEGHLRGIQSMLAEHKSCDDILMQLTAVRSAVTQVSVKLLEGHMETCVLQCIEEGEGKAALDRLKGAVAAALKQA